MSMVGGEVVLEIWTANHGKGRLQLAAEQGE